MALESNGTHNVAEAERLASVVLGAAFVALGLKRRDGLGLLAAIGGGVLIHRGATGNCRVYRALGVSTGDADAVLDQRPRRDVTSRAATVNARKSIKVEHEVTILRPRAELYDFWRNFENLPRFMKHLEDVTVLSDGRSHWVSRAPAGRTIEWDAELVNDVEDSIIAWKTVGHPTVAHAGAVNFGDAPSGGTTVRVTLDYEPPGGRLGAMVVPMLHENPDHQVREDLRQFKRLMEAEVVV